MASNHRNARFAPAYAVIAFDGVCVLCNGWVRFLLRHDRKQRYRFAAMQGDRGRELLAAHGLKPEDPVSFLLIEYDICASPKIFTDTDAMRRVLTGLGGAWRLAALFALLPRFIRDPPALRAGDFRHVSVSVAVLLSSPHLQRTL